MARRKQGFNWSGIEDNGDGTFTTEGKIEKKRLLRSLHQSGYTVRSTRNDDGSWTVATVGALSQRRRKPVSDGYKPRTRYMKATGKYVFRGGRQDRGPAPRLPLAPGAHISGNYPMGGSRSGRQSILGGVGGYLRRKAVSDLQRKQAAQNKAVEWEKTEAEINKKMASDRIQKEREEAAKQVQKNEFRRVAEQHTREQAAHAEAQRLKKIRHEEFQSRLAHQRAEKQKVYETHSSSPFRKYSSYPESENQKKYEEYNREQTKLPANLQAEREDSVT